MRMLILPLLLTASAGAAAPAETPAARESMSSAAAPKERCQRIGVHDARAPLSPVHRKLGELPPGDTLLAVYRQVDGCMEPVIVRYGDGRAPDAAPVPDPVRPRARVWR
jgi:hypothetical protein